MKIKEIKLDGKDKEFLLQFQLYINYKRDEFTNKFTNKLLKSFANAIVEKTKEKSQLVDIGRGSWKEEDVEIIEMEDLQQIIDLLLKDK